jgi:hypothetical protein
MAKTPPEDEVILVSYRGPSASLTVDDTAYPAGRILPMARRRYLELCANEGLTAAGHSFAVDLATGGVVDKPGLVELGDGPPETVAPLIAEVEEGGSELAVG